MKTIRLCADDYGFNDEVSRGILDLVERKRLSMTTALVTSPCIGKTATWLIPFQNEIDIGLHFDLTEFESPMWKPVSFKNLLQSSMLGRLESNLIKQAFRHQLQKFVTLFGRLPQFIDGHQHVHQLPIIRHAVVDVLIEENYRKQVGIRCGHERFIKILKRNVSPLKALSVACMGSRLKHLADRYEIQTNPALTGIYDFSDKEPYASKFKRMLREIDSGTVVICHPGQSSTDSRDPISQMRFTEYQFFRSPEFEEYLTVERVELARWN